MFRMMDGARQGPAFGIIVAAGRSERMGGLDKVFATLAGRPLLVWTLAAFKKCDAIDGIVIVASAESLARVHALVAEWRFEKVTAVVAGGAMRQQSVRAGVEAAADAALPLVAVASSGGARMQEGALSLMQMAKTTCAVDVLNDARVPFVAVMADPCTGGVVASFVSLADICIAEPGALLYFSGPRVIEQTTREQLPPDFGSAERNLELGHVDAVVARPELKDKVACYLRLLKGGGNPEGLDRRGARAGAARSGDGRTRRLARAATARVASAFKNPRREPVGGDGAAPGAPEEPAP